MNRAQILDQLDLYHKHIGKLTQGAEPKLIPSAASYASAQLRLDEIQIDLLKQLVENAYIEGFTHAAIVGTTCSISQIRGKAVRSWNSFSKAKRELKGIKT